MSDEYVQCNRKFESPLRWFVLVLVCVMFVGSYYCLETPAALKTQLKEYMGNPSDYETKFQLLYTLYSAPNIILPIFGGFIIDRIGARNSLLLFMGIVTTSQLIFMIGLSQKSWNVMLFGRFLFGVGNESFIIANSTLLTHWFCGNELALAFGINTTTARLGSVINNILSIYLVQNTNLLFSFWFGALLVVACLLIVIFTVILDKWMENSTKELTFTKVSQLDNSIHNTTSSKLHDEIELAEKTNSKIIKNKTGDKWKELEMCEDDWHKLQSNTNHHFNVEDSTQTINNEELEFPSNANTTDSFINDLRSLPLIFWVLIFTSSTISAAIVPFNSISSSLLLERDYFKSLSPNYPECKLMTYGCESVFNSPNEAYCPSSQWYQPPLPFNVTVAGVEYSQVYNTDVDCTNDAWRGSSDNTGCTVDYCDRIESAEMKASYIMSIPFVLGAVLSPVAGYIVDNVGQRAVTAVLAALMVLCTHCLIAFSKCNPIIPLVFQGMAVTFISVLWSASVLVVSRRAQGLAFGIFGSVLNFFWAGTPIAIAVIFNNANKLYIPSVMYLFIGLGLTGLTLGLVLNYLDSKNGSVLNSVVPPDSVNSKPSMH